MKKKDGSAVAVNLIKIAMVVIGCLLVIAFVVGFIFFGIGPTRYLPDEGTWYCEELQIQLCFDEGDIYGTHYYENGDKLLAIVIYEPGTRYFSVNPKSGRNISLFTAQCMDFDDEKMVVVEEDTGVEYIFIRKGSKKIRNVDTFSITEYQQEIEDFPENRNVGVVDKKKVAIEVARSLWLDKYGEDIKKKEIAVAYDSNEECWHIYRTYSRKRFGGGRHAIIRKDGEVLAIWFED